MKFRWGQWDRLKFYRVVSVVVTPVAIVYLGLRVLTHKDTAAHVKNRLGFATARAGNHPVIWLHAASVGELKSVKVFLRFLVINRPDHKILVTTNNPNALKLASEWVDLDLLLQAAPLDTSGSVRRFLRRWRPVAFINVEGELWPNRLTMLADLRVPTVFINTRLSDGSFRDWKRSGVAEIMLAGVKEFFCQNTTTVQRLQALGIEADRVVATRNLKSLVDAEVPERELAKLQTVFTHDKTVLAASTHKGEEAAVLAAFVELRTTDPALKLILAPRHPNRGPEVEKLVAMHGLNSAVRSKGQAPDGRTEVYLADSLGDMPLLYSLAAITFVGGSLVSKGGHTPYEPIQFDSAIVTGSHVANFVDEYTKLQDAQGCRMVAEPTELAAAIQGLMDQATRAEVIANARNALRVGEDAQELFARMIQPLGLERGPDADD